MFWRFGGYANISTLDTLLDKQEVTLEELLDESDLIQELKAQNAKLIDFLREENILERLLKYVITPKPPPASKRPTSPNHEGNKGGGGGFFKSRSKSRTKSQDANESDEEKQEAKRLKYAFVACEVLSSEVYSIYEALLANPEPLRDFWRFIKQDAPLDPLQAGYFTKVNEALLEKKTEDMIAFLKTIDDVVPNMMKHVDCPMVMDLLLKLISLEKDNDGQGVVDWLQSQNLIPMLLSYITPEYPAATQTSAGDFLKAIVTISANATGQDTSVIGPNELTRQLVSQKCVDSLIEEMLRGGNPLTVGVGIVIEVIRKNNSDYDSETQIGPEPKSSDPIYLGTLLRAFAQHIPHFMELILSSRHTIMTDNGIAVVPRSDLKVAWGEKIEPLGFDRFKTCELMAELLHCSNMGLLNEKGSDAAVKARDAERDRLKADGQLSSARQSQPAQADFGTSLDSTGYHHAEAFTPLGESPEDVKRLEVQNNGDDEEFEKVALSEVELEKETDHAAEDARNDSSNSSGLTNQMASMDLDNNTDQRDQSREEGTSPPSSLLPSKRRESLLTQQLEAEKKAALSGRPGTTSVEIPTDKPAPLFANCANAQVDVSEVAAPSEQDTHTSQPGDHPNQVPDARSEQSEPQATADQPEHFQQVPIIETEDDGSAVVGDLLKIKFVENRVVPTILDFFFRFPWNNFLHNVVYDVVQQVFNGAMDRGFNRNLAIDLFETGRITERVIEGQQQSDQAQKEKRMRLGYMGHLTLIAEEVVKFTERQPAELLAPSVVEKITSSDWINYVEQVLTETRDRDNAILGGVRPDVAGGPRQAVLNAVNAVQGGIPNAGSAALANAGIGSGVGQGLDSMDLGNAGPAGYSGGGVNLLSGFGSSDDEDDEEMEEGEMGHGGSAGLHQIDQDEQATNLENPPTSAETSPTDADRDSTSSSTTPPVPTPLAIPPSRARHRLAARLAARQQASSGDSSESNTSLSPTPTTSDSVSTSVDLPNVTTALAAATATATATAPVSGAATHAPSREEAETARPHSSEEDNDSDELNTNSSSDMHSSDNDDEDEEGPLSGLRRQTTREASREERRPIDDGSDSDDEDTSRRDKKSGDGGGGGDEEDDEQTADLDPDADIDIEDYWRLGELRAAAMKRSQAQVQVEASHSAIARSRSSLERKRAGVKEKEQASLLQQWGLAEGACGAGGNEEEDDDDDAGVEMGTKYLKKRA